MAIGEESTKKIRFEASDGVSPFMKKLMEDQKKLYSEFSKEAQKQTNNQKEQLKIIEQQIKALERKSRLEKEILKDQVRSLREYGGEKEQIRADVLEQQIRDRRFSDKNKIHGLRDMLQDDRDRIPEQKKESVFSGTLLAGLVRDVLSGLRQTANAGTGLDLLSPIASLSAGATGGALGTAIDASNIKIFGSGLGDTQLGPILASLGKEAGGFLGDAITRSFKLRSEFDTTAFGYRAFTGRNANVPGMSSMAYDDIAVAQTMQRIAAARGGSGAGVRNVLGLQRGFGINEGAILGAAGLERMGTGGITNAQRGLGIAIAEGINRSRFTDVITNQTAILQEFSKTANAPSSIEANRALFEFNRLGGPFGIGDPRALGNITAIQEGLSNPNNAFGQAQNYAVLRRLNPNASVWELRKMQQQGLQSPGFLNAILNDIAGGTGSEDFQKFQLMNRFPGLSMDAVDTLFKNRGKLGSMSQSELSNMLSSSEIQRQGEDNTSKLMRYSAEVSNAFRDSFVDGIRTIKAQFVSELGQAAKEVANILREEFGIGGTEDAGSYKTVRENYVPKKNGKLGEAEIKSMPLQPMGGKGVSSAQIKSLRGQ